MRGSPRWYAAARAASWRTSRRMTSLPSKWSRVVPMKVAIAPAVGHTTFAARLPSGSGSAVIRISSKGGRDDEAGCDRGDAASMPKVARGDLVDDDTLHRQAPSQAVQALHTQSNMTR